jgi:hypothetical protein
MGYACGKETPLGRFALKDFARLLNNFILTRHAEETTQFGDFHPPTSEYDVKTGLIITWQKL